MTYYIFGNQCFDFKQLIHTRWNFILHTFICKCIHIIILNLSECIFNFVMIFWIIDWIFDWLINAWFGFSFHSSFNNCVFYKNPFGIRIIILDQKFENNIHENDSQGTSKKYLMWESISIVNEMKYFCKEKLKIIVKNYDLDFKNIIWEFIFG